MATASDICTLCEPTSPSISKESRLDSITVEQPEKFKSIVKPNKKMKLESAFQPTSNIVYQHVNAKIIRI